MIDYVKIPVAIQIICDDVGWQEGVDGRLDGKPSRSGLTRRHSPLDYKILNEIGKAVDMKIACPFIIGEWDKDNVLRGEKNITYDEKGWDRKNEINYNVAQKCFEEIEKSEYIEITFHGLLHGFYHNDEQICETEFSHPPFDEKSGTFKEGAVMLSPDEMQRHIDLFYKIYNSWGFTKKIRSFCAPASIFNKPEELTDFVKVLRDNGFLYWSNTWDVLMDSTCVIDGVTFMQKKITGPRFEHYDVDPALLIDGCSPMKWRNTPVGHDACALGFHWTNFVRLDPENNLERLPDWVKFLKRQENVFGQILSKDIAFAASQVLYNRFSKITLLDDKCIIDLSDVIAQGALELKNEFYVSIMFDHIPKSITGGSLELYDQKVEFNTYKIKVEPEVSKVEILFK